MGITLFVYLQTATFNFTNFDDNVYIFQNEHVTKGFSWESLIWAFKSVCAGNWHPLTLISHMLDCQISGLDAGAHHLTSVILHTINSLLLFVVLWLMTDRRGLSWIVAMLFAVHPLHVESVAWLAERKDVLSTLFWFLTVLAYWYFTREPSLSRYILTLLLYMLGLLTKPMLVSLPITLLLLDYWPLKRMQGFGVQRESGQLHRIQSIASLFVEKIPLFILAAGSSIITFVVQHATGAVKPLDAFPLGVRLANAVWAYGQYIVKTFYPVRLACFYPHPGNTLPLWQVLITAIVLALVTMCAVMWRRKAPYLFVGWMWYVITLIPVIGIVQVGKQSMADRYTYVPIIGVFVLTVWSCYHLLNTIKQQIGVPLRYVALLVASIVVVILALGARRQTSYWRNDTTIWERALAVTKNNAVAHYNLGTTLATQGDIEGAIEHFLKALRIDPRKHEAYANLGVMLAEKGRYEDAVRYLLKAVRLRPRDAVYRANLGLALVQQGRYSEAIPHLKFALSKHPDDESCREALAEAVEQLRQE
ncbi:MAG: tetratricopeptide repeat protein [Armatimonadota bacterium]